MTTYCFICGLRTLKGGSVHEKCKALPEDKREIERRRRLVDNARKFCEWATALRNSWTDWEKIEKR